MGLTVVAMGDSHGHHYLVEDIPDGDVLIHTGDFTRRGSRDNVDEFAEWFYSQPHKHKIVIAGNHDWALQKYPGYGNVFTQTGGIDYLEDSGIEIDGFKFWGSPWTLPFQSWAFMMEEEELTKKYALIPEDVDVLITHGPPVNVLDMTLKDGVNAGSLALAWRIGAILTERSTYANADGTAKPINHVFGHIHERYGQFDNGIDTYYAYNVSVCDFKYNVVNPPTVIEL